MGDRLKFWMVWRENSPTTRHRHLTKREAEDEAERLAQIHPGETFYVLKTVAAMSANHPPVERHNLSLDEVPL